MHHTIREMNLFRPSQWGISLMKSIVKKKESWDFMEAGKQGSPRERWTWLLSENMGDDDGSLLLTFTGREKDGGVS